MSLTAPNLYVHFPFCRRKCSYCALYSRAIEVRSRKLEGRSEREDYVQKIVDLLTSTLYTLPSTFNTVYFGGGSPALCDLKPIFAALSKYISSETEFTVELHPEDVTEEKLLELKAGGVNRISMGLQSLDDATLKAMNRGYSYEFAAEKFALIKRYFENVGVDLIVGFPGDPCEGYEKLATWGLKHCSVYSLQNERNLRNVPDDDWVLDKLKEVAAVLDSLGLKRYEISNHAEPGFECRHNLATWCGEDYLGLGEGAHGRVGLKRSAFGKVEEVDEETDFKERRLFRLRTYFGLDTSSRADWAKTMDKFVQEGLALKYGNVYRLTPRGYEVCDSILSELV